MRTRRATLRVAHQKDCPNHGTSVLDSVKPGFKVNGKPSRCTCRPSFYTFHRDGTGKPQKGARIHDLEDAERALNALRARLDLGGTLYVPPKPRTFNEHASEWLASHRGKQATVDSYRHTIKVARQAFGHHDLREITADDVSRFLQKLEDEALIRQKDKENPKRLSEASLARHLRGLHACFEAAGLDRNPVKLLHRSQRPKAGQTAGDHFTDDELPKLWKAMEDLEHDPVYIAVAKTAVTTGLRLGELLALKRQDVDLRNDELHVRASYRAGVGETPPKSGKARIVDLTPDAHQVLKEWLGTLGLGPADQLLFARADGSHLHPATVTRERLQTAMAHARIPEKGERGHRRTFHSLRSTFARCALEAGQPMYWVSTQLGHSSIAVTERSYAGYARAARKKQAELLAAGTFAI